MNEITASRECSTCRVTKPETVEYFYAHKPSRGGLTAQCKVCRQEKIRAYHATGGGKLVRNKVYTSRKQSGASRLSQRAYREKNPEKCKAIVKGWRLRNSERVKSVARAYYQATKCGRVRV